MAYLQCCSDVEFVKKTLVFFWLRVYKPERNPMIIADNINIIRCRKFRQILILVGIFGILQAVKAGEVYHINRTFTPVEFNLQGVPPVDLLNQESEKLTDTVRGDPIVIDSNGTYAIEQQMAIALGYDTAEAAWNAAIIYQGTSSNYPGKIFDNVGWVRGTKSVQGEWGAYLWVLQNRIAFQSSTSVWWRASTNGVPVMITNVIVGSLGNYAPMSNVVDIGPHLDAATNNFPGANQSESREFYVDITNVFYQLSIPDIFITPLDAVACVGGSNVQYSVTGTNIPNGVTWTINPSGVGAEIYPSNDWHFAVVTPGNVATNYKIRATSVDNTNFYVEVNLVVCKIEVTNIKFNHNTGSSANDAINIRQDYDTAYDISNGEWVKGGTNIPACYTANKTVTIKARLITTPTANLEADVWAVSTDSGGSLGDVVKTNVTFVSGVANDVMFQISGTTPNCVKKTTADVWEWKIENINGSGSAVCALNTSGVHTVYIILDEPVDPWGNSYNTSNNAWTKALDFTIVNASCNGDSTAPNALIHIAQYLHTGHNLTYDIDGGRPKYNLYDIFDLTGYIDKSSTLYGTAGNVVNCYDQAGGVSVCARLLGISAEYVFMGYTPYNGRPPFGYILATDLIGVGTCNNPFYPTIAPTNNIPLLGTGGVTDLVGTNRSMFGNHAFVRYDGLICDACAGPHLGTETLIQYSTSAIDITSMPEREESPDGSTWGGNTNGVFSTNEVNNALDPADITGVK